MRGALSRATAAVAVVLAAATAARAAPDLTFVPTSPRVADVIFVTLHPEKELLRAACSWAGKSYQFLPGSAGFELVLPVPLKTKPGDHHAMVYWKYADGAMGQARVPVQVQPREFGVQHLKLSRSQEKKYSAPETKRERALIGAALDQVGRQRRWRGEFVMPLEGRISTEFGLQRYVNGRLSYRHRGLDIAAPEGTPVRAAADGMVSLADDSFLLHGQTIILDHGHGVSSLYLHLSRIDVQEGQFAMKGDIIGRVGATGVATGPHLHFATYAHHEPVDPFLWTQIAE
jgi:hypothetical protein